LPRIGAVLKRRGVDAAPGPIHLLAMRLLLRLPSVIFALVVAATSAQFPEFVQQYSQRLGGAVDELALFVQRFDADARDSGLDRAQALEQYRTQDNSFLDRRGSAVAETIDRYERLAAHKQALDEAGPVGRLVTFAGDYQPDIAERALGDYEPAVPVTVEGFVFAVSGFAIALAGWLGIGRMARRARRRSRGNAVPNA
jgi:hypothetical protein